MYLLIAIVLAIYFTGLTASIYHWARSQDEDIACALFWFIYWPIQWFLLLISVPFDLAAELGELHRRKK